MGCAAGVLISGRDRNFYLFQDVYSYTAGTTASFVSGEGPGLEANHSRACKTKGKNTWSCTPTAVLMFAVLY